jgi:hypothetical protein
MVSRTRPGNHVLRVGGHVQSANRADVSAGFRVDDVAHGDREVRGRQQRILPIRHRSSGMIRKAGDRHLVAIDRDDALHHTHRNVLAFERPAMLKGSNDARRAVG